VASRHATPPIMGIPLAFFPSMQLPDDPNWNQYVVCSLLCRHVVLPPEVAKLLPKNRLLSEVCKAPQVMLTFGTFYLLPKQVMDA